MSDFVVSVVTSFARVYVSLAGNTVTVGEKEESAVKVECGRIDRAFV